MKTKMIRRTLEDRVPRTAEDEARLDALFARPDSEIDLSDIPEWTEEDFRNAIPGRFYRAIKQQVTMKLDSDIVAWLKKDGPGYQTRLNAILRVAMLMALNDEKKAA